MDAAVIATLLFVAISAGVVLAWNACFSPVPWRLAALLLLFVCVFQAETLFTEKVDFPGRLAYVAYPWSVLGRKPVHANTGIAFQQIGPWTEAGRESLRAGIAPLWNRRVGCGIPLMTDQQSAIFHPFTLAGLFLPLGKAFTLSIALRLFFALFFMLVFLRNWGLHESAAVFGSIAYGFSTFHIVWLTMPHSLTAMMLPMALAGTDELLRRPGFRSWVLLVAALAMTILGGHPELEFFVASVACGYALYVRAGVRRLLLAGAAAVMALILTAFYWLPTLSVLPLSERYAHMVALRQHPPHHEIGPPWLMTLVSPDILGTVPGSTYRSPEPRSPDLLDDYGEIASGYTGLTTLALAIAGLPLLRRRRPAAFAVGAMIVALLTIAEIPGWAFFLRHVPLVSLALWQRLRFVWNLGLVVLAAIAFDAILRGEIGRKSLVIGSGLAAVLLAIIAAIGLPRLLERGGSVLEIAQVLVPFGVLVVSAALLRPRFAMVVAALTFFELAFVTFRFNPPSEPEDVFPVTGAIRALRADHEPHRMVALGWSFIPDTPGYYGLEDVKTTDPMTTPQYRRLFTGYFAASGWDQVVGATHYPFTDYLGVRYFYVPPGDSPKRDDIVAIYRGDDGTVYRNDHALPRYFFVSQFGVEPSFDGTVARLKQVADFRKVAYVDHIPALVRDAGLDPGAGTLAGGSVRIARYGPNTTDLDVDSRGWNLLVTSDTWWPGWRAYWNGSRTPPVRVNGAFLGVFVPPGRGRLRLRYAPKEFDYGLRIAGVGLIILIATGVSRVVKR